ncbi:Bicoid-interacting protein 3-domain-containing protein [Russula earlei]|uniref:Bicoid-interacting protein 3-domain-containing protein n=1 Tax=Russula earlei TaxID=71964 RepID=A0ACC0U7D0_9AGAM|nr:Bicoid-interacting protein 3-domain-containing protein [Russula earlei]
MTAVSSTIPTHGNYHNYHGYRYHHPGGHDSRLALLPRGLFANARVLDVGCNEAQSWGARRVVGVDIDDTLVRMAWRRRRTLWSHQAPLSSAGTSRPNSKRERAPVPASPPVADYFPASCQHMFGPLPIPAADTLDFDISENTFPHNISFRRADWVNESIPEDDGGYNVIVAFSVSKWIHLNGGDAGLSRFFERVYATLVSGGTFVLEAQPRESYIKARKLHPTLQENAQTSQMRPEDFEATLCSIGFKPGQRLGEPGEGRFRRPVDLYVKR